MEDRKYEELQIRRIGKQVIERCETCMPCKRGCGSCVLGPNGDEVEKLSASMKKQLLDEFCNGDKELADLVERSIVENHDDYDDDDWVECVGEDDQGDE